MYISLLKCISLSANQILHLSNILSSIVSLLALDTLFPGVGIHSRTRTTVCHDIPQPHEGCSHQRHHIYITREVRSLPATAHLLRPLTVRAGRIEGFQLLQTKLLLNAVAVDESDAGFIAVGLQCSH